MTNPNLNHIVETESVEDCANLAEVWESVKTPVYHIVDDDGVNVAGARIRRLAMDHWIYVDDTDGYSMMNDDLIRGMFLVPQEKHIPYGWDRDGNVLPIEQCR